jgi:hypothetical protein
MTLSKLHVVQVARLFERQQDALHGSLGDQVEPARSFKMLVLDVNVLRALHRVVAVRCRRRRLHEVRHVRAGCQWPRRICLSRPPHCRRLVLFAVRARFSALRIYAAGAKNEAFRSI